MSNITRKAQRAATKPGFLKSRPNIASLPILLEQMNALSAVRNGMVVPNQHGRLQKVVASADGRISERWLERFRAKYFINVTQWAHLSIPGEARFKQLQRQIDRMTPRHRQPRISMLPRIIARSGRAAQQRTAA
jgi:hypothetical protein